MRRALLVSALLLAACATVEDARPPAGPEPAMLEPTEHPPEPDFANVPRDLKVLGGMVPRWASPGGPRAALSASTTFQLLPRQGILRALDNSSGEARWRARVDATDAARPLALGDRVVVPTASGLTAFDARTGEEAWRWEGIVADVRAGDDRVFVLGPPQATVGLASGGPQVLELDPADGRVRWAKPCRASCRLVDARGAAVLVAPAPGRLLRVEGGRVTQTLAGLRSVQAALLDGDGVLVATSTAVVRSDAQGVRFSSSAPYVRGVSRRGPYALVDAQAALLGLDPATGAERFRIRLGPDLQGKLRVEQAAHFPEGQTLIPTEDLFGAAPAYLLVRDDGTLRVVRYGHPRLRTIETAGDLALYASDNELVLSGTRRRGAPIRHYETPAQDVEAQLRLLARPADDAAAFDAQARARIWLWRLGRPVYETALYATIAGADSEALPGLLTVLRADHPSDARVVEQAVWRLTIAAPSPAVAQARLWGLSRLPSPWPEQLWPRLLEEAPIWLEGLPPIGLTASEATPPPWRRRPPPAPAARPTASEALTPRPAAPDPGLRQRPPRRDLPVRAAQSHARAGLMALAPMTAEAVPAGYVEALWRRLTPVVEARRAAFPCPWPEALARGRWPVPSRCPLTAPPPGATLDDAGQIAAWRAGAAGDPRDVWVMTRDGARWGPPRFTSVRAGAPITALFGGRRPSLEAGGETLVLPDLRRLGADRDRDGLTDRLEARLGTDPRRADTDGDGRPDGQDPSPSCSDLPSDDLAEMLRRGVAQNVAALSLEPGPWRDASERCLAASLLRGPLLRETQDSLPGAGELAVDVLEGAAKAAAVEAAVRSGQLPAAPEPDAHTIVVRWSRRPAGEAASGATLIFVRRAGRHRGVAVVDVHIGSR